VTGVQTCALPIWELGWPTIGGEVQKRKLVFYERIRRLGNERWVKQVLDNVERYPTKNSWFQRIQEAQEKLGVQTQGVNTPKWKEEIKRKWRKREQQWWQIEVGKRRSMRAYPESKLGNKKKSYIDFTAESKILTRARIGNIVEKWAREDNCSECGDNMESPEIHIILECPKVEQWRVTSQYRDWINLKRGLGLTNTEILKEMLAETGETNKRVISFLVRRYNQGKQERRGQNIGEGGNSSE
jgi:hypothetical protein